MKRILMTLLALVALGMPAGASDMDDIEALVSKIGSKLRTLDILKHLKITKEASGEEAWALRVTGGASLGESYEVYRTPNYKEITEFTLAWPGVGGQTNHEVEVIAVRSAKERRIFKFDGKGYRLFVPPAPDPVLPR